MAYRNLLAQRLQRRRLTDDPVVPDPDPPVYDPENPTRLPEGARRRVREIRTGAWDPGDRETWFDSATEGSGTVPIYTPDAITATDWNALLGPAEQAMLEARAASRGELVDAARERSRREMQYHIMSNFGADVLQGLSGQTIARPDLRNQVLSSRAEADRMEAQARGQANIEQTQQAYDAELRRIEEQLRVEEAMRQQERDIYSADVGSMETLRGFSNENEDAVNFNLTQERAEEAEHREAVLAAAATKEERDRWEREMQLKEQKRRDDQAYRRGQLAIQEMNAVTARIRANRASGAVTGAQATTVANEALTGLDEEIYRLDRAIVAAGNRSSADALVEQRSKLILKRTEFLVENPGLTSAFVPPEEPGVARARMDREMNENLQGTFLGNFGTDRLGSFGPRSTPEARIRRRIASQGADAGVDLTYQIMREDPSFTQQDAEAILKSIRSDEL